MNQGGGEAPRAFRVSRKRAGFTLVEILASLAILAIGLSAIVGLVFAAKRVTVSTVDRNTARSIINEAVAEIERVHLVTKDMLFVSAQTVPPADEGLLIETVDSATNPNTHRLPYSDAQVYGLGLGVLLNKYCAMPCYAGALNTATAQTMLWPYFPNIPDPVKPVEPKYASGQINGPTDQEAIAYRVVYRLERHPDWFDYGTGVENVGSVFVGTYTLTLSVFRDPDRKGTRLEQITDPVVVYVRDKKVR